jgi:putative flippase GtrA
MPDPSRPPRGGAFARSTLVGVLATFVDLGLVALAVGALHVAPRAANVPALLAGAVVQFVGNRRFAFRAGSGSLRRQIALFSLTELAALALNGLLFELVARLVPLGAAGAVATRAITTNAVYVLYSYPLWRRVFRPAVAASG